MKKKRQQMRIPFNITAKHLREKVHKPNDLKNYLYEKYGRLKLETYEWKETYAEWKAMSEKQKMKYRVVQPDGTVRLDYLMREVNQNGKTETLAY